MRAWIHGQAQVAALFARVRDEQKGRLDIVVTSSAATRKPSGCRFWKQRSTRGCVARQEVDSPIITARHAAAAMVESRKKATHVGLTDGDGIGYPEFLLRFRQALTIRLAYAMAETLRARVASSPDAGLHAYRVDARLRRRDRGELARGGGDDKEERGFGFIASETPASSGAPSPRSPPTRTCWRSRAALRVGTLAEEYASRTRRSRPNSKRYFEENFKAMMNARRRRVFAGRSNATRDRQRPHGAAGEARRIVRQSLRARAGVCTVAGCLCREFG